MKLIVYFKGSRADKHMTLARLPKFGIDNRLVLAMVASSWLLVIAFGFSILLKYESTPAPLKTVQTKWPSCSLTHSSAVPTLVMIVHPQCPCTRASINELAVLMTHCRNKLKANVLFFTPIGAKESWKKTDLLSSASAIPGVTVITDRGGTLASQFAATTSGQTLLYDPEGRLIFDGGITSARGHFGDNNSLDALESEVLQGSNKLCLTKVYGCSILNDKMQSDIASPGNINCTRPSGKTPTTVSASIPGR